MASIRFAHCASRSSAKKLLLSVPIYHLSHCFGSVSTSFRLHCTVASPICLIHGASLSLLENYRPCRRSRSFTVSTPCFDFPHPRFGSFHSREAKSLMVCIICRDPYLSAFLFTSHACALFTHLTSGHMDADQYKCNTDVNEIIRVLVVLVMQVVMVGWYHQWRAMLPKLAKEVRTCF